MEYYWNMFNNSTSTSNSNSLRGHNGNFTTTPNHAWQFSDLATSSSSSSRVDWTNNNSLNYPLSTAGSEFHALLQEDKGPHHCKPDPHLTCLNLGKRHYFENVNGAAPAIGDRKKGKLGHRENTTAPPRCQVEGCEAMLVNAKDYHRRHKVCERHAKAPRVVVLGIEQRFCQQCSRFHVVGEFDEAKRSCRRRLAGHNERRRKTSQHPSLSSIKHSQGIHPHYLNSGACAHSLLSSTNNSNIPAAADLPARCSAALNELIAENRASILAYKQQLDCNQIEDPEFNYYMNGSIRAGSSNPRFFNMHENGDHVTLNLMRDPNSTFGLLPVHDQNKSIRGEKEDSCSELWKYPLGY